MGYRLAIRAAVPIWRQAGGRIAIVVERTTENRERRSIRAAIQAEHPSIERYELRRRLISGTRHGVHATYRQLLQDVALECHGWNRDRGYDRKGNSYPFAVEK